MIDMTEEFKFLKPSKPKEDGNEIIGSIDSTRVEDERASFTVLDPAKVTARILWLSGGLS